MNRMEFMTELERLLADMPEEERQAAVQYYADYFADAGEANEADVIRELGSPEKVAESIKADLTKPIMNIRITWKNTGSALLMKETEAVRITGRTADRIRQEMAPETEQVRRKKADLGLVTR